MNLDRDGPRMVSLRAGPPWIAGTGEYREPFADEIEGGDGAVVPVNPAVRQPAVEIPGEGFGGAGAGTGWLRGAVDVVQPDWPAFGLVGVEQVSRRPPAQDPGKLPPEVEGVLDGGVHAGAASWRHAVGSVTGEEATALAIPAGYLRREREAAEPLDACPEITDAGRAGDQTGQLMLTKVSEPGLADSPLS